MSHERLPAPAERTAVHERTVRLMGYRRADGLWDIEAGLVDRRRYDSLMNEKGRLPAGEPVHDIELRVTVDDAMVVRSVVAAMVAIPYATCPGALASLSGLEGASLSRGWRQRVDECLGGIRGCTHVRALLVQIASAAFQTIPVWHAQARGDVIRPEEGRPPPHLGTCTTWAFDGPVVARIYPEFAEPGEPDQRAPARNFFNSP